MVEQFGTFVEVFIQASVEECARRDVKGLYAKAFAGEIKEFTGVSDPYEVPENPDFVADTENETPEESAEKLIAYLEQRGQLRRRLRLQVQLAPVEHRLLGQHVAGRVPVGPRGRRAERQDRAREHDGLDGPDRVRQRPANVCEHGREHMGRAAGWRVRSRSS